MIRSSLKFSLPTRPRDTRNIASYIQNKRVVVFAAPNSIDPHDITGKLWVCVGLFHNIMIPPPPWLSFAGGSSSELRSSIRFIRRSEKQTFPPLAQTYVWLAPQWRQRDFTMRKGLLWFSLRASIGRRNVREMSSSCP